MSGFTDFCHFAEQVHAQDTEFFTSRGGSGRYIIGDPYLVGYCSITRILV
jgi:hypothetical protein